MTTICFYNFCDIFISFVFVVLLVPAYQPALEKTRNCISAVYVLNFIFPSHHIHVAPIWYLAAQSHEFQFAVIFKRSVQRPANTDRSQQFAKGVCVCEFPTQISSEFRIHK